MTVDQYLQGKTLTEVTILSNKIIGLTTNAGQASLDVDTTSIPAYTPVEKTAVFSINNNVLTANGVSINTTQTYIKPTVPVNVPREITLWQLRVELKNRNLDTSVENAIDALSEPNKTIALEAWNRANVVLRNSPTVSLIQQSLGLSSLQVDDIFVKANSISA